MLAFKKDQRFFIVSFVMEGYPEEGEDEWIDTRFYGGIKATKRATEKIARSCRHLYTKSRIDSFVTAPQFLAKNHYTVDYWLKCTRDDE